MLWFRAVASASQTLQVPFKKRTNWVVCPKQGGAGWECTAPTSLLSAHKPWDSCIAAICVLWGNSKNTCRSGTWNQEKYLSLLYIPLEVWIWHFQTFYILLSIHLALWNPATFFQKEQRQSCLKVGNCLGFYFFPYLIQKHWCFRFLVLPQKQEHLVRLIAKRRKENEKALRSTDM